MKGSLTYISGFALLRRERAPAGLRDTWAFWSDWLLHEKEASTQEEISESKFAWWAALMKTVFTGTEGRMQWNGLHILL